MPKYDPFIKIGISVDPLSSLPLYQQLYERLRSGILAGQLHAGLRLPSTRSLARELGVSRNTVITAYEQLLAEGYIESRIGHGTCVVALLPEHLSNVSPLSPTSRLATFPHPALSRRGSLIAQVPFIPRGQPSFERVPPFRAGTPALDAFPFALWTRLIQRHARTSLPAFASYQSPTGYQPLREAIASHLGIVRGVRCTAEQIMIVSGSQGALDLAARMLLDPGDDVWVEDPGYLGARNALLAAGANLIAVPVDQEGISVTQGQMCSPQARLAVVTPSHQFPLGMTMSLSRRLALLEWARQADAWILEDDYDSEYRFTGRPLSSLQSLDTTQRVLYIGTFSKVLFPSLRLGFLVVPTDLVEAFSNAQRMARDHQPLLEQIVLADFITEGHFERHLRIMRTLYAERATSFVRIAQQELGSLIEMERPHTGLHIIGWLPPGADDQRAAFSARSQGIEVLPLSIFGQDSSHARGGFLFGYAPFDEETMRSGLRRLSTAVREILP